MKSALETTWLLKNTVEKSDFVSKIGSDFDVEIDPPTTSNMTVYDDFDANLWNADHILCRVNKQVFQLNNASGCIGEVRASAKAS